MNHYLPPMPHGQPPIPPSRRQHEVPYSSAPPMRSSPGYMGYHHPHAHANAPLPPYPAQQYQHWYSYQQGPPPHPPQQYQPYAPLIVSSYPRPHSAIPGPPPQSMPPQPSTTSSTPLQSSFSATPPPSSTPSSVVVDSQVTGPVNPLSHSPTISAGESSVATRSSPAPPTPPPAIIPERPKEIPLSRRIFQPPLPWLSVPEAPFPAKVPRRRRKARALQSSSVAVEFRVKHEQATEKVEETTQLAESLIPEASEPQTPTTSQPTSELGLPQPTTPSSAAPTPATSRAQPAVPPTNAARPLAPVVPVVPIFPSSPSASKQPQSAAAPRDSATPKSGPAEAADSQSGQDVSVDVPQPAESTPAAEESPKPAAVRAPPKSWADLVRTKASTTGPNAIAASTGVSGPAVSRSESLVDVLSSLGSTYEQFGSKIAFVEPRGLVNTGNMCYMNSILQILVFCIPFYEFLDKIGRRAVHSFKSELPLIDSMIMFMREFRVIDAATSVEQLRLRLKQTELEQYGDSFTPEYVYQVIRHLPRFRDMRRGHQQDAQEFLGFLLEELHEECALAMKQASATGSDASTPTEVDTPATGDENGADGWLEVGHKQKPSVTRSSGHTSAESPVTRIFGGKLRSEFRVPGNKNSVTLEPYQSLQLDIGSPQVNNIIDALKGLTKPETIQGDFNSSRGSKVTATKQVFIESLPPVLILHLKRFHYDSVTNGTQKIWKKVGYPLELEIPREVFPPHRRNMLAAQGSGLPKYRLTGVIYHHGKNASGGHYTVDVRRQDGREWIRLDDTVIRRVRSEDVANAGSEEDPKILAAALERHKAVDKLSQGNIFEQFDQEEHDQDSERGWSQVNGTSSSGHTSKKSMAAAVTNGNASPTAASGETSGRRTPIGRFGARDNKVAYLLFYEKIYAP
ncbi:hypothetical protein AJ80_05516 [Polytolypa hystricis UAMH7299]|uniref:Ubiquitin carboxyl-terminal hydrolase n=1 Tax=Polytolypa hystricis (strain UAMH7299) TaxID=1447883 RepID=A0A2B7Y2X9_POLH7|nr:hypothetical protein AJ80_05516 [Polytolypa hystricis UAMH7299]